MSLGGRAVAQAGDKDAKSESEATALMVLAAGVGDVTGPLRAALELGCDAETTDDEGWTALHWAAFHGNLSGAACLAAAAPALLAMKDDDGKTALALAQEELESATAELAELKGSGDGSAQHEEQTAAKAKQVATKEAIRALLEGAARGSGGAAADGTEGLEEID